MNCPGCGKPVPWSAARAYGGKHGLHHGSVCPHCGAHYRPSAPWWQLFALAFMGWLAIHAMQSWLVPFSDLVFVGLAAAWIAALAVWYSTRPLIVVGHEKDSP